MYPQVELVMPNDAAELSNALKRAREDGLRVRIAGGTTKLDWGRSVEADLCIGMAGMNRFREHLWQDMTCTVDAGIPWATMQHTLAQHGQRVALDPLFADTATVGGVIATNDSGVLRMKYGSLRDLVIGMTVVLPDGTIAKSGGKVVKNVAGYDLPKLMIGAFGTLGVIAEVTFRLHAIPRHTRHFTLIEHPKILRQTLLELSRSQLSLEAMQLRDNQHLDVALSAMPDVLEQQLSRLSGFVEADASIWDARESLFADPERIVLTIGVLPTQILMATLRIAALGGASVAQSTGLVTAAVPATADIATLRAQLETELGSLTILHQPTPLHDPWGTPPDSIALQRLIKHRFDPNRTLNPGIFLDGSI